MRLFLVDNNSGYIFADTANLAGYYEARIGDIENDAMLASRLFEESIGEHGRRYAFRRSNPRTNETGYHIYSDRSGGSLVTTVVDGQDQEIIDVVTEQGDYEGFVTCFSAES